MTRTTHIKKVKPQKPTSSAGGHKDPNNGCIPVR